MKALLNFWHQKLGTKYLVLAGVVVLGLWAWAFSVGFGFGKDAALSQNADEAALATEQD